jgi:hypothetical protein
VIKSQHVYSVPHGQKIPPAKPYPYPNESRPSKPITFLPISAYPLYLTTNILSLCLSFVLSRNLETATNPFFQIPDPKPKALEGGLPNSRFHRLREEPGSERAMDSDQGKLFIGGISWETTEEKLKEYFDNYGDVLQTVVMREKATGRPRGFGFVVFADPSILDRVLQDTHTIDGRTVRQKALSDSRIIWACFSCLVNGFLFFLMLRSLGIDGLVY